MGSLLKVAMVLMGLGMVTVGTIYVNRDKISKYIGPTVTRVKVSKVEIVKVTECETFDWSCSNKKMEVKKENDFYNNFVFCSTARMHFLSRSKNEETCREANEILYGLRHPK